MTFFRDHADAMRVIGATFAGHRIYMQESTSWMVRGTREGKPEIAYHFVITWLPHRALVITGDLDAAVYSGITHLSSLDDTVRLIREASMDYLSGKSTHTRVFDRERTARFIVETAYMQMRDSFDVSGETPRDVRDMDRIVSWHHGSILKPVVSVHTPNERKDACRALIADDEVSDDDLVDIAGDWDVCRYSWPATAHWHYEALRTWADLMVRAKVEQRRNEALQH